MCQPEMVLSPDHVLNFFRVNYNFLEMTFCTVLRHCQIQLRESLGELFFFNILILFSALSKNDSLRILPQ